MAATAIVEGHFVTATYREWDPFTDSRTNQEVKGGRKFLVSVYTPHDDDLVEVQADMESIDKLQRALSPATFGTTVRVICNVNRYGKYIGYTAEVIAPTSKAA
jgi:hypothetical protein